MFVIFVIFVISPKLKNGLFYCISICSLLSPFYFLLSISCSFFLMLFSVVICYVLCYIIVYIYM